MRHACEQVSQLSSARLDRRLSVLELLRLRLHLLMCSACRNYDAQLLRLRHAFQYHQQRQQLGLPIEKRKKIKQALDELPNKKV